MRVVLLALALICAGSQLVIAEEIKEIVVEDNKKTTSDTVILIADVDIGDEWKPEMADAIKQRLVSSGLFSDVEVFWDPAKEGGGIRLHILAKDKHSWIIAPAFYNQPTNTGGGVGFGENNLFGLNQKLLIYGQIATGDSFFIGAWVIPSIGGSPFYAQLDTYDKYSRNIEYAPPTKWFDNPGPVRESRLTYINGGIRLGVELFRGIKFDTRLRGAHVSYSKVHVPGDEAMTLAKPGKEGWDISNEFSFTIDRRANWYGVQSGTRFSLAFEHSVPALGSDFHYWTLFGSGYRAIKILSRHNLVLKASFNYGNHLPFQQEVLTGGTQMRGWLNNQFRGDTRILTNVEYSAPLFTIESLYGLSVRGLAFWDSAYTTFNSTDNPERDYLASAGYNYAVRGLAGFKNSVGIGTRFYLREIVLPLLGLDFGYGVEAGDFQVYLAIGLTD